MRDTAVMRPWANPAPDVVASAVEAARLASKNRAYWANAQAQILLHRFFQRADGVPDAQGLLERVLGIARGTHAMYERSGREIANVILGVLTHPACATVPIEAFPAVATALRPTANQVIALPLETYDAVMVALTQAVADDYALDAVDFEAVMDRALQTEVDAAMGPSQ